MLSHYFLFCFFGNLFYEHFELAEFGNFSSNNFATLMTAMQLVRNQLQQEKIFSFSHHRHLLI